MLWVDWARTCLINRGQASAARGNRDEALVLATRAATLSYGGSRQTPDLGSRYLIAQAQVLRGDQLAAVKDGKGARSSWAAALDILPRGGSEAPSHKAVRYRLLKRLGRRQEADALASALDSIGYRHPDFVAERRKISI